MAELMSVVMVGVEVAKKILDVWKEKKRKPRRPTAEEFAKLLETHKESIESEYTELLEKLSLSTLESETLSSKQLNNIVATRINELSRPSIFFRDRLIEMNSVLNRGLGKIDLYYTLISKSSSKVKDIVVLQSRFLIPRMNKDLNRFVAIMEKLDAAVIAEIQTNFCGASKEYESDFKSQTTHLENIKSIGADFSASDIENWLHSYRDYIECCLEGVNKSITYT